MYYEAKLIDPESSQAEILKKVFEMPNSQRIMPEEYKAFQNLDLGSSSSDQELQKMTDSLNKIIEKNMADYISFNLLSREDNIIAIFNLVTLEDVNKFISTGILVPFPKVCQLRTDQDGNVSQIVLTDVGHVYELKNSISLALLQTNVAGFFLSLEKLASDALKEVMVASQLSLNTVDGNFSEENFGNLPSQIIITLFLIELTNKFSSAIKANQTHQLVAELDQWIQNLAQRFRAGLSQSRRIVLESLTVNIAAYRDLAHKLADCGSQEKCSQLWNDHPQWSFQNGVVVVQNQGVTIQYKYRLLDTRNLLVITDLSWTAFKTFFGQDKSKVSHICLGPLGTGKTETYKDNCWYLGISLGIFNCSDQMTEDSQCRQMINCVDECHSVCFDEFNRVSQEFMHKISTQINQLPKQNTLHIGITCNPGYPGRNVIIDEIKNQAHSVLNFTIPNLNLILDNMLICQGFTQNRALAAKLMQFVEYLLEQSQNGFIGKLPYLDFGLRNIKRAILSAGRLLQSGEEESFAIAVAVRDQFVRMLPMNLQAQIHALASLTFLGAGHVKQTQLQYFTTCKFSHIQNSKYSTLFEKLQSSNVHLVVKQSPFEVAQDLSNFLNNIGVFESKTYPIEGIPQNANENQQRDSLYAAYGFMDGKTWVDGFIPQIFREAAASPLVNHYIIFHGAGSTNPIYVEQLNTVLDDNKTLLLANGERLARTPNMRFVFVGTQEDFNHATPAFIARCSAHVFE